jgi:hypothetical protein
MPEKSVNVRAIALLGIVDVGDDNESVCRKPLHELDHIPTRDVELFAKMFKGRPCVSFSTRKVGEIRVKLLRLLGDLPTFL